MFGVLIAHQAEAVGADVGLADIVAPDDHDVRLLVLSEAWQSAEACPKQTGSAKARRVSDTHVFSSR